MAGDTVTVEDGTAGTTDLDDDGTFEDVNGNGWLDDDADTPFDGFDSDSVRLDENAYDCNDNGELDYDDIVDRYEQVD